MNESIEITINLLIAALPAWVSLHSLSLRYISFFAGSCSRFIVIHRYYPRRSGKGRGERGDENSGGGAENDGSGGSTSVSTRYYQYQTLMKGSGAERTVDKFCIRDTRSQPNLYSEEVLYGSWGAKGGFCCN